jgi:orotidine-5'-phosphate decarboxylase
MAALRQALPHVLFLIPGFGTQGASAADTAPAFREDGLGAVVNSARGIIFAFEPDAPDWDAGVEAAARATIADLAGATAMGRLART